MQSFARPDAWKEVDIMKIINNKYKYLKWLQKQGLSSGTINLYKIIISYYNRPLDNKNLTSFIKQLTKNHEPTTCRSYRNALFSYAKFKDLKLDWKIINKLIPVSQKKSFVTINEEDLIKLKAAKIERNQTNHEKNNLILDFLFYSGIRINELLNIKHGDWNGQSLKVLGKGNKIRQVLLPEDFTKYFKNSKTYLFTSEQGTKLDAGNIRRIIKKKAKLAGINKTISPHTFRRSFATLLNNRGSNLVTIQKLLGHANINTTISYIHQDFNAFYQDYSKLWKNR